jgi:carotenoid cleavage dioxygenase-like enzyme
MEPATTSPETDASTTAGPALGFTSLEDEVRLDAIPLHGEVPSWLDGALLRTGPAKFEAGEQRFRHWFDGQAMLHRFGISGETGTVSYASRFLRTKAYAATAEGRIGYSEFATDPCRGIFKRMMQVFDPGLSDNCNVNLVKLGERYIAMTETPIPVQFDGETLDTAGVAYDVPGMLTTAHPHLDRATGGMLNYAAKLGPRNEYRFFKLGKEKGAKAEVVASMPTNRPAYMHSFGLSERYLILAEFPFVVDPKRLVLSGKPYIENYRWEPERGTRITLFDRRDGRQVGPFTTGPFFCFHHLNAFDAPDGTVVIDMQTYEDASIIDELYLDRVRVPGGPRLSPPRVERVTVDPSAPPGAPAGRETLFDPGFELGRINYGRCNERPYRYAWGLAPSEAIGWIDTIVRADIDSRELISWSEPGAYPGEPVFVARPGAEREDDGVLLSVVLDTAAERSFLLILDASDLSELGRAVAPHHIPFSFHGQFANG